MPEKPYPHIAILELFEKLVATIPGLKRKGKANPYTSLNGNMFTFLDKEGKLSLRLGAEDREGLIDKYKAQPSIQYGAVMPEYVIVPDELMSNQSVLEVLIKKSYDYACTFKPKPTKKSK